MQRGLESPAQISVTEIVLCRGLSGFAGESRPLGHIAARIEAPSKASNPSPISHQYRHEPILGVRIREARVPTPYLGKLKIIDQITFKNCFT